MAAGLLSYQRLSHEQRVSRLKNSIPNPSDDHPLQKVSKHPHQQPRYRATQTLSTVLNSRVSRRRRSADH